MYIVGWDSRFFIIWRHCPGHNSMPIRFTNIQINFLIFDDKICRIRPWSEFIRVNFPYAECLFDRSCQFRILKILNFGLCPIFGDTTPEMLLLWLVGCSIGSWALHSKRCSQLFQRQTFNHRNTRDSCCKEKSITTTEAEKRLPIPYQWWELCFWCLSFLIVLKVAFEKGTLKHLWTQLTNRFGSAFPLSSNTY